ncbi:MAG: hypothetical protein HY326_03430 [Chloroflexi bacterium]|nr:hypothetical protein [Chloroflexota bacterium]
MSFWQRLNPPSRLPIMAILVLFLLLGLIYAWATPVFEASDELWHYPLVKHLSDGGGLPVQHPGVHTPWEQEGSQPPLYYIVMAGLTRWIDTGDFNTVRQLNPHAKVGIALAENNKNMVIHRPAMEIFPYHGTVLAIYLIRWLSLLIAAAGVFFTYRAGLLAFPGRPRLALGAAALHAFNPMFLFISASVNNDTLAVTLSAVAFYLTLELWRKKEHLPGGADRHSGGRLATLFPFPSSLPLQLILGVVLGAGALSKLSALTLLPITGLVVVIQAYRLLTAGISSEPGGASPAPSPFRAALLYLLQAGLAIGLPFLLIAGWWFYRNLLLYGELTGIATMVAVAGPRLETISVWDLSKEWQGFRYSFWALFGGVNILARPWVYSFFDGLSMAAGLGLLMWLSGKLALGRGPGWPVTFMLLWVGLTFVALVRWTLMTYASQGRLMFPAMTGLALLMVLGLMEVWNAVVFYLGFILPPLSRLTMKVTDGLALVLPLPLLVLAGIIPLRYIHPVYVPPPQIPVIDQAEIPNAGYRAYDNKVALLGYELDHQMLQVGDKLHLTLYWKSLGQFDHNYSIYVHILDAQQKVLGQQDTYPGGGSISTQELQPGMMLVDRLEVPVDRNPVGTGPRAQIQVGFYDMTTQVRLPVTDAAGRRIDGLPLTYVKVGQSTAPAQLPAGATPLQENFSQMIQLEGYRLETSTLVPGKPVHLTLYWQGLQIPDKDYTLFVHLVDRNGHQIGQNDHQPQGGEFPTSLWEPGEWIPDDFDLVPDRGAPAGQYHLEMGWYELASGRRLDRLDVQGKPVDTQIVIPGLTVSP